MNRQYWDIEYDLLEFGEPSRVSTIFNRKKGEGTESAVQRAEIDAFASRLESSVTLKNAKNPEAPLGDWTLPV